MGMEQMTDPSGVDEVVRALLEDAEYIDAYDCFVGSPDLISRTQRAAADLLTAQAARIAGLEDWDRKRCQDIMDLGKQIGELTAERDRAIKLAGQNFHEDHGREKSVVLAEAEAQKLRAALDAAVAANRTRPDYDLRCQDCERAHILDTSLPSVIWNQIAEPSDVLCTTCIDDRLVAKGLTADAEFYFVGKALACKLYGSDAEDELRAERDEAVEVVRGLMLHVPLYHENDDKHDRVHAALDHAREFLSKHGAPDE